MVVAATHVFLAIILTVSLLQSFSFASSSVRVGIAPSPRRLRRCSANYCSRFGARTKCLFKPSAKSRRRRLTCLRYSRTAQSRKQCAFACILICNPPEEQPLASNGKRFCSACQLKSFSCGTRYRVYGPVKEKPRPKPREKCSVGYCGSNGAAAKCLFEGKASTCGKWAFTDEKKKACDFACLQVCTDGAVDNNGKGYCSLCHLLGASCASNFKIYAVTSGGGVSSRKLQ